MKNPKNTATHGWLTAANELPAAGAIPNTASYKLPEPWPRADESPDEGGAVSPLLFREGLISYASFGLILRSNS
ncbi:hypothetical protein LINPERHAP2_LOCUS7723 [Linum perenne]